MLRGMPCTWIVVGKHTSAAPSPDSINLATKQCWPTRLVISKPYRPRKAKHSPPGRIEAAAQSMTTLISFDVDGTLIHSVGEHANRLHKEAFTAAFKQVFNLDTSIDVIQHHGSTDPLILIKVLTDAHGIDKDQAMAKLPKMQQAMVDFYVAQSGRAGQGLELLPGVKELLLALKERGDVAVCLVTGNMEPIGWTKMEALGIKHLFTEPFFGGFGSGNTEQSWKDRAELVRIAAKRAEEHLSGGLRARFHVGDAPMDVSAAEAAGAQAIGVTTGIYTRQELANAGQSVVVLDGLQDLQSIFEVFNLS